MNAIVITGAGSGLGRQLAIEYSNSHVTIVLIGRSVTTLKETKKLIEESGNTADYYVCDIQNLESVQSICSQITTTYKLISLMNNAGIGCFGELDTLNDLSIRQVIETNILGTIYMTKYFLPHLQLAPESKIVNIISTAGLRGKPNESVYCASKFAVRGFTESLQKELEGSCVKVTGVYMGGMETPFWDETNHITDRSRLRSVALVAKQIKVEDDGRLEIHIP
ncbi:SDR family NAD(P)-dependent oxidoreductase [Bacillus sp. DJP31]|uniref:SDR family NAD(P)-dependent oxidoreductase n=1 Tax=Bacillus sp. DJP31 TaxID=3409789 RepID=UPI003BB523A1